MPRRDGLQPSVLRRLGVERHVGFDHEDNTLPAAVQVTLDLAGATPQDPPRRYVQIFQLPASTAAFDRCRESIACPMNQRVRQLRSSHARQRRGRDLHSCAGDDCDPPRDAVVFAPTCRTETAAPRPIASASRKPIPSSTARRCGCWPNARRTPAMPFRSPMLLPRRFKSVAAGSGCCGPIRRLPQDPGHPVEVLSHRADHRGVDQGQAVDRLGQVVLVGCAHRDPGIGHRLGGVRPP